MEEITYEIWQDDFCVAGSDDYTDAMHYAILYQQDGSVLLYKVVSNKTLLHRFEKTG